MIRAAEQPLLDALPQTFVRCCTQPDWKLVVTEWFASVGSLFVISWPSLGNIYGVFAR